ncbi:MAG: polysaccharide deacetylase family protein [Chitinophagaceae bacterium]|nr:polysaccharide deacetylase family protein [Chitinophagaceae bacterium]
MVLVTVSMMLMFEIVSAQTNWVWHNKRCAVVLTYDDALDVHLNNVVPALDSLKLKGTFYLTCKEPAFTQRIAAWKRAAAKGHELANHTIFHPCTGGPGREWLSADYDLRNYSVKRMQDEVRLTNDLLHIADGKKKRTFAYPCGDLKIHDSLYLDTTLFVAARGTENTLTGIDQKDLYNIGCFAVDMHTGEQLIAEVKKAMAAGKALVFLFHGVGGGHDLNVSLEAHRQLLHFLKANQKEIWVPSFIEMAEWIKGN